MLVLPAGKSGHIEAGVAYGLGKKCYAIGEYDATDSLYNIFGINCKGEHKYERKIKVSGPSGTIPDGVLCNKFRISGLPQRIFQKRTELQLHPDRLHPGRRGYHFRYHPASVGHRGRPFKEPQRHHKISVSGGNGSDMQPAHRRELHTRHAHHLPFRGILYVRAAHGRFHHS